MEILKVITLLAFICGGLHTKRQMGSLSKHYRHVKDSLEVTGTYNKQQIQHITDSLHRPMLIKYGY